MKIQFLVFILHQYKGNPKPGGNIFNQKKENSNLY